MGKRGPKPTPKGILRLRGSHRAQTLGPTQSANTGRPRRPTWLKGEGKKAWDYICPLLVKCGRLAEEDRFALACLCQSWADYCAAVALCTGPLVKTMQGNIIQHPAVSIRNKSLEQVYRGCAKFGLTPIDRSGMEAPPVIGDNAKAKFFGGGA